MKLVTVTPTGAGSSCGLKEGTDIVWQGIARPVAWLRTAEGLKQQLEALS